MAAFKSKVNKQKFNKCLLTTLREMFDDKSVHIKKCLRKNKEHYVYVKCDGGRRFDFESHGFEKIDSNVWIDNVNYERAVYIIENLTPPATFSTATIERLQLSVDIFFV
jgi:hypothetical protein